MRREDIVRVPTCPRWIMTPPHHPRESSPACGVRFVEAIEFADCSGQTMTTSGPRFSSTLEVTVLYKDLMVYALSPRLMLVSLEQPSLLFSLVCRDPFNIEQHV
jgi:hypothetical protein